MTLHFFSGQAAAIAVPRSCWEGTTADG